MPKKIRFSSVPGAIPAFFGHSAPGFLVPVATITYGVQKDTGGNIDLGEMALKDWKNVGDSAMALDCA